MKNKGIYRIINLLDGKSYIGSAQNLKRRWVAHCNQLTKNTHYNLNLQRAWNKYGSLNFNFEILEYVENDGLLIEREQHFLDKHKTYVRKNGYNILRYAGSTLGRKHSAKTKYLNGLRHKGKKISDRQKAILSEKLSGNKNPMYGKKHSEQTIILIKQNKAPCDGEKNGSVKLTTEKVLKIRDQYSTGMFKQSDLAKIYGINQQSISNIIMKKTWKFL